MAGVGDPRQGRTLGPTTAFGPTGVVPKEGSCGPLMAAFPWSGVSKSLGVLLLDEEMIVSVLEGFGREVSLEAVVRE